MNINVEDFEKGDLLLMTCLAVPNDLKKEAWIKDDTKLYHNVKVKEETSILYPIFILKSENSIWKYNYVYFGGTKRYYFVDNIRMIYGGCFELQCSVDPLMSFQKSIMNCIAFENRSSNKGTGYIADNQMIFNSAPKTRIWQFDEDTEVGKNFNGLSYVLGVANDKKFVTIADATKQYLIPNDVDFDNFRRRGTIGTNPLRDALIDIMHTNYPYQWGAGHSSGATAYDCSGAIDTALNMAYPNIPLGYPSTDGLGEFLYYRCHKKKQGETTYENYAYCSVSSATATVEPETGVIRIPKNSILFLCASASDEFNRDTEHFPATDPDAWDDLGVPNSKRAHCGYGHVVFYAGHLVYHDTDRKYYNYTDDIVNINGTDYTMKTLCNNPPESEKGHWHDMVSDCIIHCTTGNMTQWDETLKKWNTKSTNKTVITKLYDYERICGIFTPNYTDFQTKWGNNNG
jgi:hypothetical protein